MEETTKPGFKTLGFYLAMLATLGSALIASGADVGAVGSAVAAGVTGLTAAGYAAFRAFKKSADPTKPAWKTTEFWLSIAAALLSVAYASGLVSDGGTVEKIVGIGASLLAMLGYQVTKPKA